VIAPESSLRICQRLADYRLITLVTIGNLHVG